MKAHDKIRKYELWLAYAKKKSKHEALVKVCWTCSDEGWKDRGEKQLLASASDCGDG